MKQEQHVDLEKMLGILASGLRNDYSFDSFSTEDAEHLANIQLLGFTQA